MAFSSLSELFKSIANKLRSPMFFEVATSIANSIAEDARNNVLSEDSVPNIVASAIIVGHAVQDSYITRIDVEVDSDMAPMAAAYEFGSGLWGDKNAKYPIRAKDADALKFFWLPGGAKIEPYAEWVSFQQIMHPGVEARPYLRPALEANIHTAKAKLIRATIELMKDEFSVGVSYASK